MLRIGMILAILIGLVSCASNSHPLKVSYEYIKDTQLGSIRSQDQALLRSEKQKRLYGALTSRERQARLGHYYTFHWNLKDKALGDQLTLRFEYRQAATGELVYQKEKTIPWDQKGRLEFQVIGDEYQNRGRVLAWRAQILVGEQVVTSRNSYLWE